MAPQKQTPPASEPAASKHAVRSTATNFFDNRMTGEDVMTKEANLFFDPTGAKPVVKFPGNGTTGTQNATEPANTATIEQTAGSHQTNSSVLPPPTIPASTPPSLSATSISTETKVFTNSPWPQPGLLSALSWYQSPSAFPKFGESTSISVIGNSSAHTNAEVPSAKRPCFSLGPFSGSAVTSKYLVGEYVVLNPWKNSEGAKTLATITVGLRSAAQDMVWIMPVSDTGTTGCTLLVPTANLVKIKYQPGIKIPVQIGWKRLEISATVESAKMQAGKLYYTMTLNGKSFSAFEDDIS